MIFPSLEYGKSGGNSDEQANEVDINFNLKIRKQINEVSINFNLNMRKQIIETNINFNLGDHNFQKSNTDVLFLNSGMKFCKLICNYNFPSSKHT